LNGEQKLSASVQNEDTNTDTTAVLLGSDVYNYFEPGMPCEYTLFSIDPAPIITLNTDDSNLYLNSTLRIRC